MFIDYIYIQEGILTADNQNLLKFREYKIISCFFS